MSYHETDRLLHQLSQVLAKFNRTYVPAKDDDSHTNIGYGPINRRLFSRWTQQTDMRHILSLEINPMSFALLDESYRRELEVVCTMKFRNTTTRMIRFKISVKRSIWNGRTYEP